MCLVCSHTVQNGSSVLWVTMVEFCELLQSLCLDVQHWERMRAREGENGLDCKVGEEAGSSTGMFGKVPTGRSILITGG